MRFISAFLLSAVTLTLSTANTRVVKKAITISNGGGWGYWGEKVFCPQGTFAYAYKIQLEQTQGNGDDTALNNIGLICSDGTFITGQTYSTTWGDWLGPRRCYAKRSLVAFRMMVQKDQGEAEDTAANAIQFKCRTPMNATELRVPPSMRGLRGEWGDWSEECPPETDLCGLQIKFETAIGEGDDTAMNDLKLFCCAKPQKCK